MLEYCVRPCFVFEETCTLYLFCRETFQHPWTRLIAMKLLQSYTRLHVAQYAAAAHCRYASGGSSARVSGRECGLRAWPFRSMRWKR